MSKSQPNPDLSHITINCVLGAAVVALKQADRRNVKYMMIEGNPAPLNPNASSLTITLDPILDDSLFIKLIDNIADTYEFSEIMDILDLGSEYFENLEITMRTANRVQRWINRLGRTRYIWQNLTQSPDYNLELFRARYYPFFHVKSKEWKQIAAEGGAQANYPPVASHFEKGCDEDDDFRSESNVAKRHNNFMGYPVLNPSKYGNIAEHTKCLGILIKLNLNLEALEAFMRLCITPASCHIVKSPEVWGLIKPLINDAETKSIIDYCLYYAYYILRHESTKMFSQVRRAYRVIFNYAEILAQPDTHTAHIECDPNIQQLSDDTFIDLTVPFYLREARAINPPDVFARRLFLATGGAISGIDFKSLGASISGSILIPCVTKSPLEKRFEGVDSYAKRITFRAPYEESLAREDKDFLAYLEYFYPSYESLKPAEYTKTVAERRLDIAKFNMRAHIEEKERQHDPDDRASSEGIDYNKLADIDISITTSTFDEFRERAGILCDQIKANCKYRGAVWMAEIETLSSFKFTIYGPGLTRPLDVFRIPYDPAKMVKKFHVPGVRMWYEGCIIARIDHDIHIESSVNPGLYAYDSCVNALKSGVNDAYKWFSCNKIPADVILKYAERGITTILNKKERAALVEYMKISPRWNALANAADTFGVMRDTHKFFHPAMFDAGIRMGLRNDIFPPEDSFYSKRMPISYPQNITAYDGNLAVKTHNELYPPNIENITKFIRHARNQIDSDSD